MRTDAPMNSTLHDTMYAAVSRLAEEAGVTLPPQARENGSMLELAAAAGVDETELARAAAAVLGLPFMVDPAAHPASGEFVARIPIAFARQHGLLGLGVESSGSGTMTVAVGGWGKWEQLEVVARYLGRPVEPALAP